MLLVLCVGVRVDIRVKRNDRADVVVKKEMVQSRENIYKSDSFSTVEMTDQKSGRRRALFCARV